MYYRGDWLRRAYGFSLHFVAFAITVALFLFRRGRNLLVSSDLALMLIIPDNLITFSPGMVSPFFFRLLSGCGAILTKFFLKRK